jgi:hypothetical protein
MFKIAFFFPDGYLLHGFKINEFEKEISNENIFSQRRRGATKYKRATVLNRGTLAKYLLRSYNVASLRLCEIFFQNCNTLTLAGCEPALNRIVTVQECDATMLKKGMKPGA